MILIPAKDGYKIASKIYTPSLHNKRKVLIINSATGVDKKLYHHYANFMATNGYTVVVYDYRGIAQSRPKKLRGFKTSFIDWGQKDFSGVLDFVKQKFPDYKIIVLGHSIGGTIIGMTKINTDISGIINIGAQTAYYKDWAKNKKIKIYILWHVFLPTITRLFGYFPGKKLGMLEDIPMGVIQQWHNRRKQENMKEQIENNGVAFYYSEFTGKLLTLGIEDDPIGTEIAIKRIHDLFVNSEKDMEIIRLNQLPTKQIGHFGFFSRKFKNNLWLKTLRWFDNI